MKSSQRQNGLSMIELLISLAISSFLILGITQVYIDNKRNQVFQLNQMGNLEGSRFAALVIDQYLGKAGRNRWLGKRPLTRGVAKNPVDHPHGGGEGRTSGGRHPVSPWGKPTKGARTRHNKSTDKMIIRSRHAKKKR